ncbi:hypothetical protein LEN26_020887 [Aphanomyces euteiches]|nr:hypothetical protein LEN26_020887 [Aphanomyces euteiches]
MVAYIHEPIVSADEISHLLDTYRSRLDASSSSYSASMYLNWTTEAQVALIVPRVLNTVQNVFPQTSVHVESVALTLYTRGQSYGWHLDAYNQNTLRSRAFTFLVYLNDVDEGGETVFAHVASNGAFIVRKPSLAQACAIDSRHARHPSGSCSFGFQHNDLNNTSASLGHITLQTVSSTETVDKAMEGNRNEEDAAPASTPKRPVLRRHSTTKHLPSTNEAHLGWNDDENRRTRQLETSKEEFVLEFYNPHVMSNGNPSTQPSLVNTMRKTQLLLDRIGSPNRERRPSVLSFVDPLQGMTRQELKRSNLLRPVQQLPSSPSSPSKKQNRGETQRCRQCNSAHIVLVPVCKYCKKLDVLGSDMTALKRFGYSLLDKNPPILPSQLIDELVAYLHEHPMTSKSTPSLTKGQPAAVETKSVVSIDEVSRLVDESHQPIKLSSRALLELKQFRSKPSGHATLSHATKATLVRCILHAFAQSLGESVVWSKEERWDHQDLCLEMLKTLSMDDVSDIMRAYNAWKHVDEIAKMHQYDNDEAQVLWGRSTLPATPSSNSIVSSNGADQVVPDVHSFQLLRRKAIRSSVSPEKIRKMIEQKTTTSPWSFNASPTRSSEKADEEVSLLQERHEAEQEEQFKLVLLNAERFKTISSDGMFSLDNTTFLMQSLASQDLATVLLYDKQTQEMFLLGDEAERESLLHLSAIGRVDAVSAWIAKTIDCRNLLIAATTAKGQLLSSDERRLLLALDDEDARYHLQLWKHWQHLPAGTLPVPNLAFLQLNTMGRRCADREELFRVPRLWLKVVKVRDNSIQPMPLKLIRSLLLTIYHAAFKQRVDSYDFVEFVLAHIALTYGGQLKPRLQGFITALEQYYIKDTWILAFCRFCGIADSLPSDCFMFYLSAVQSLQFAVPNRSQVADYFIPNDLFHPLFIKKAAMALRAIGTDANIDEAKWFGALQECRVVCPRRGAVGRPLYVVGLAAFMEVVLDMWLANRKAMEDEMRRLFKQFDTDKSQSLSYDEFKAFIVHCTKDLKGKVHVVDEKHIVKLYGKCLMHSDESEITIDSFVLGGLDNPMIMAMCGFSVPPTKTSAVDIVALQLIMRAMRAYIKRTRRAKTTNDS